MSPPRLTFVCGDCGNELNMTCGRCDGQHYDEACTKDQLDRQKDQENRAWMMTVPGVRELSEAIDADVTLDMSFDEDGYTIFSAKTVFFGADLSGESTGDDGSHAAAVHDLRSVITDYLRDLAS